MMTRRAPTAGFTLIEVLVALALFALISGAGFAMLDLVLRTQARTEGRLERLAALQRAMYLVTGDFLQARSRSLTAIPGAGATGAGGAGEGATGAGGIVVSMRRNAADLAEGAVRLTYRLDEGVLMRIVTGNSGTPLAEQALLADITRAAWTFYDPQAGWVTDWPPAGLLPGTDPPNPAAIALRLALADGTELRRVALLPREGG